MSTIPIVRHATRRTGPAQSRCRRRVVPLGTAGRESSRPRDPRSPRI